MLEEITAATRLVIVCNPNNPTSTALPLDEIAEFVRAVPRHVARDPRRGLLRVQPAAGPRRVARAARPPPEPRAAAHVLEGLRPLRAARRLRRCAARRSSARRSTRCASRSSATPPRRPPAIEALKHQDEVARRVERNLAERIELEDGLRRLGIEPAESQANFVWFDLPDGRSTRPSAIVRGARRARRARARGRRARPRGRAARDGRHRGREREASSRRSSRCCAERRFADRTGGEPPILWYNRLGTHDGHPSDRTRAAPSPRPPAVRYAYASPTAPGDLARRSAGVASCQPPSAIPGPEGRAPLPPAARGPPSPGE